MHLDPLDVKILQELQKDSRLSFREIAERVESTTPTVSARVKALEDIGLIRGYEARLDHTLLGASTYVLQITIDPKAARESLRALQHLQGIHAAHLLAGGRIVALVHLRPPQYTLAMLHEAVVQLPGLVSYDASEVIDGHAHGGLPEIPERVEVACHQCRGPIHGDPVRARFADRTHVFCCRQCLADFRARFEAHEKAAAKTAGHTPRFKLG